MSEQLGRWSRMRRPTQVAPSMLRSCGVEDGSVDGRPGHLLPWRVWACSSWPAGHVQQLTAPASLTVVGTPDEGSAQDLQVQPDAVWREPADDAVDAVEQFTATAFGWAASDLSIEGVTERGRARVATVSHRPTNVSVTILLTPAPEQQWQVVQVQSEATTGATLTPREIQLPVPAGAPRWTCTPSWTATPSTTAGAADASSPRRSSTSWPWTTVGGVLVVYRDAAGEVVDAYGGHFGTGSEQPTEPQPRRRPTATRHRYPGWIAHRPKTARSTTTRTPTESRRRSHAGGTRLARHQQHRRPLPSGPGPTQRHRRVPAPPG